MKLYVGSSPDIARKKERIDLFYLSDGTLVLDAACMVYLQCYLSAYSSRTHGSSWCATSRPGTVGSSRLVGDGVMVLLAAAWERITGATSGEGEPRPGTGAAVRMVLLRTERGAPPGSQATSGRASLGRDGVDRGRLESDRPADRIG